MENKTKCTHCIDGEIGRIREEICTPSYIIGNLPVYCSFCDGTGYIDEPENEENGVTKDYDPKGGAIDGQPKMYTTEDLKQAKIDVLEDARKRLIEKYTIEPVKVYMHETITKLEIEILNESNDND